MEIGLANPLKSLGKATEEMNFGRDLIIQSLIPSIWAMVDFSKPSNVDKDASKLSNSDRYFEGGKLQQKVKET